MIHRDTMRAQAAFRAAVALIEKEDNKPGGRTVSYHRISHSEADLSREEKIFAANVHQFAAVPARSLKDTLADVIPSDATWFDVLIALLTGLFWLGAVLTGALFFWVVTP